VVLAQSEVGDLLALNCAAWKKNPDV